MNSTQALAKPKPVETNAKSDAVHMDQLTHSDEAATTIAIQFHGRPTAEMYTHLAEYATFQAGIFARKEAKKKVTA